MKKLLLLFFLLSQTLCATRPVRYTFRVQQTDGTSLLVQKEGNAHFGFYATTDGIALLRGADGAMYYAMPTAEGNDLVASALLAHDTAERTAKEEAFIYNKACRKAEAYQMMAANSPALVPDSRATATSDGMLPRGTDAGGVVASQGAPKIPVIMVAFQDVPFQATSTEEKINRWLNEEGYHDETLSRGSVRDYFKAQSDGLFKPDFIVVHKMTAAHERAYYGKNSGTKKDEHVRDLIREAIDHAREAGVDFTKYNVGTAVPLVAVFFAGAGEHAAFEQGSDDYIWAHFLNGFNYTSGNATIRSYFVGCEIMQSYGSGPDDIVGATFDGIGTFCHEFGHALGLPDWYYTGSDAQLAQSLHTLEYWSVMDYGQYAYDSYRPMGYTAFERASMGWLKMEELDEAGCYTLAPIHDAAAAEPRAYIIRNDENPAEYYILENHQEATWYSSKFGTGMLVTKVDYQRATWTGNKVNNTPTRQGYEIIPADNQKSGIGGFNATRQADYQGDLFPGTKNVTTLTDTTRPGTLVATGGGLGKGIFGISMDADGFVRFAFLDPNLSGVQRATSEALGDVQYFDLTGRRVLRPTHGQVYLRRIQGHTEKIIF